MLYALGMYELSTQGRKVYLDVLRIAAIFLVLFNHTGAWYYPCSRVPDTLFGVGELIVSISDKIAVPLFFMISGALLLVKQESIRQLLRKRVWRYVVVIALFQVIQHAYAHYVHGVGFTKRELLRHCVQGEPPCYGNYVNYAVWFLYAYLSYLLILPLLRIMVKHMRNVHFLYLFAVQMVLWAFVPYENTGCSTWLPFCNSVFLYVLAGYYVEHRVDLNRIGRKHVLWLLLASAGCILLSAGMTEMARRLAGGATITQNVLCFKGGLLIPCITIYLLAKKAMARMDSARVVGVLKTLGGAVFTIMLIENILRWVAECCLSPYMGRDSLAGIYAADICTVLLACAIGFPIGIILKKIPVVNRYV